MIGGISGKHSGLLEEGIVCLVQAFIVSCVVYVVLCLSLRKSNHGNLDTRIQVAVKRMLALPAKASMKCLLQLEDPQHGGVAD